MTDTRFRGKRVIVTGAGSSSDGVGNGMAAAVLYARAGASLVLVDRDPDALQTTAAAVREHGVSATCVTCDVASHAGVDEYIGRALSELGGVDVLHCNVGIAGDQPVETTSDDRWRLIFRVNVDSLMLACRAVLPLMREGGGGAIVNVSSIASIRATGTPFPAYAASKAAANALIREVAVEGAPYGVRANSVVVGYVDTPTVARAYAGQMGRWEELAESRSRALPRGKQGTAWDTARAGLYLASGDADFVTGTHVLVDGGMTAVAGGPIFSLLKDESAGAYT